jgi:pimeloyl-ACP methyl ester carboxylesterase
MMLKQINTPLKRLNIQGKNWEYIATGEGKSTFLLLPGGGQTAQYNFHLINSFKDQYKVVAITIYDTNSIEECCNAISTILQKENADQNIVAYGLSLGGLIAQSYLKRNKDKVNRLILSHACTPKSKTYKNKVIRPLQYLSYVLPLVPNSLIRFFSKNFAGNIQGVKNKFPIPDFTKEEREVLKYYSREFTNKYLNKRLLQTWIKLHFDFFKNELFERNEFKYWRGKVLVLRTDNDPLMQDEGEFEKIYPTIVIKTFKGTGHLTFYYRATEIIDSIKRFLRE